MKIVSRILVVYIMLLCCIPCPDVERHDNRHEISFSASSCRSHHCDHDLCSPFCTCQCCHVNYCCSFSPGLPQTPVFQVVYHETAADFHNVDLGDLLIPPKA